MECVVLKENDFKMRSSTWASFLFALFSLCFMRNIIIRRSLHMAGISGKKWALKKGTRNNRYTRTDLMWDLIFAGIGLTLLIWIVF